MGAVDPDVWYTVIGNGANITASLCSGTTNYDTQIDIYTGACNGLVGIACNDEYCGSKSQITWFSTVGITYHIRVYGYSGLTGNFTLSITSTASCGGSIINNNCANAIPLFCGNVVSGSTSNATLDGPSEDCDGLSVAADVWYTIIGNGADITASLCIGTNYDTKIDIYTGSCTALSSVACDDDGCGYPLSQVIWSSTTATTYYIRVHGYGGQTGNFQLSITCTDPCTLEADAGEDVSICQGFSTQLNGSYTGSGSSEVSYEWSPTTGLDDPYSATPTANPTTTTTYTLTISAGGDCISTDEVTVTVTPAPLAAITGTTSVCEGGAIALIASGGNCYLWTGPDGYSSTGHSFSRTLATPEMSGIYTVYVGFLNCDAGEVCPATATIYVTVYPTPVATITGNSPVCSGGSISLSALGGWAAYAWSGPGGFTASGNSMTRNNATTLMSGLYTVTVTGGGGCTASASKSVVVSSVATAAISGASSFCSGNTISLTATTAGASYQWSGPGGFSFYDPWPGHIGNGRHLYRYRYRCRRLHLYQKQSHYHIGFAHGNY